MGVYEYNKYDPNVSACFARIGYNTLFYNVYTVRLFTVLLQ